MLFGCGGSTQNKQPKPPETLREKAPAAEQPAATAPDATAPKSSPSPKPSPKAKAAVREQDYDMSYRDCQTLAATYRRAWLADKLKTTSKMNEKQAALAATNFKRAAEKAGADWEQACAQTVGSPRIRRHLVCASKARSVQRFNNCLDGKLK